MRFGPNVFEAAIELTKLRQHSAVKMYQERFEELPNRTTGLTEHFFASCFVSGLREDIKSGIISQAIGLERQQEESAEALARQTRFPPQPTFSGGAPSTTSLTIPKPMPSVGVRSEPKFTNPVAVETRFPSSFSNNSTQIPIKRITPKEMEGGKRAYVIIVMKDL